MSRTVATLEKVKSQRTVTSLDDFKKDKLGTSNVFEETISHADTYNATYEAKDVSRTFSLKIHVNAHEKVKISLSRKGKHEEFLDISHNENEQYHNLKEQVSQLLTKNEFLTAHNTALLDIIEGQRRTNDELITEKEKEEEKMDRLQMKLQYFKYYSFIWGFSAVLASTFVLLGLFGILSAFPAISGFFATVVGMAGAFIDWKDRVKTYGS